MAPALAATPAGPLGVAVSGGGDSVALLLLLAATGRPLAAASVDHGLRPESPLEAAAVAALCRERGIPHETFRWQRPIRGNLQMAARDGRTALLAEWAHRRGLAAVALAHTLDDQAETVLMRLARGSGVDGLSGMAPVTERAGTIWLRPLLTVRRQALRDWLAAEGIAWAEDPSNADPAYQRVRMRAALAALAPLGIGADRLAATAARMAGAREALEAAVAALAAEAACATQEGEARLDPARIAAAPLEVGLRLLSAAVMWVSGAAYRPRRARLERVHAALADPGRGLTLAGTVIRPLRDGRVAVRREAAHTGPPVPLGTDWDGRWRLAAGEPVAGYVVAALGPEGLASRPRWREVSKAPRETLMTTPAVRDGEGRLVAAPFLGEGPWRFRRVAPLPPPFALAEP